MRTPSKIKSLFALPFFLLWCAPSLYAQFNPSLIGDAVAQGNDCFQITPNLNGQSGAIWSPDRINMLGNFIIEFRIYLGTNDANGADGLTFVMKNNPTPLIGGLGGGMGYQGIPNSFAVEFDTWQNASDPNFDHIAMVSGGVNDHSLPQNLAGPVAASATSINVEDGQEHDVRIEWNGASQTMKVYFDCDERLIYTGDLINQVFAGSVFSYFGFTGSTGGAANLQRVCFDYISFANNVGNLDDVAICAGDTITNVDATINGAVGYLWTPVNGVSNPAIANPTFTPAVTTTYTVDIINSCGDVIQEDFTATVGALPTANQIADFDVCDDASNDGTITYDLSQLDATVLGVQDPVLYAVSYYASQVDADSRINTLPTSYINTAICERIYARIESITSTSCYQTTDFELCVSIEPVANPVATYRLCDDSSNNNLEVFDLVSRNPEVLLAQNPTAFQIEYFVNQADADLGSAGGATPVSNLYSSSGQTMYVRIENIANTDCFDTNTFVLIVDDLPMSNAQMTSLNLCDDLSNNGTEDIDLISLFTADVLGSQTTPPFEVSYHVNQADADANNASLPSPFTIAIGTTSIFARIDNTDNQTCFDTTPITIILHEQAIANAVTDFRICDDRSNDGVEDFDLSSKDSEVLGTQNPANFTIEYFSSQAEADLGSAGGATPVPTLFNSGSTTLFVRIQGNTYTDCPETAVFDLFVDPLPIAGTPADIIVCDDPSNDGTEDVNLSQFEGAILDGQTNTSFNVTYHVTQSDADNNTSPLASPYTVTSSTPNIFARIDNADNDTCYTTSTFRFVISPTPTANPVMDMIACDDPGNDGSEIFDLSTANSQVLNGQTAGDFNITFHASQNDADMNTGGLAIMYASSTTTPETIFIRIEAIANPECADLTSFTLTVSEQPTAGIGIDLVGCDDISNDGFEEFDFSTQDASIYNGQSTTNFTVTYHTSMADADTGDNFLNFPYTNTSRAQTIYARIENAANTECYDVSTFNIEVFARPTITNQGSYKICAGVTETIDAGPGFSSYLWSTGETTQSIAVSSSGDYTVTATNSDGCDSTATVTVVESDVAVIERIDVGQFEVNTNTLTAIIAGSGSYEFSLDGFEYQDSPRFTNLYPGLYTIFVRDKNGCGTISMNAAIIGGPPYFTPNQDGYHDTWQVTAVEIIPDARIYILDRYGKFIKQISATGPGWDGTYNGNPMPSSDYWYLVELADGQSFRGHFALKR